MSLYDKTDRRELLFDNPVFQSANLAIRNAWFSGGVEWNGPLYGHSLLTCSPVFVGRVDTPRGPIVRVYEFDRALETTWQVDLFLFQADRALWAHVRAVNPNARDIRFYWWTNIAVPLTRDTRVLAPSDYAISHGGEGNTPLAFPVFDGFDGSYPVRYPYSKSVFFRKPGRAWAWSACVDGEGLGLCHVSTPTLGGRKLFTWGSGRGGQRWMDYLSQPGRGNYIEIQGGVTPTQLQTRPLQAGAAIKWTECFAPLRLAAADAHDADYARACASAEQTIARHAPAAALSDTDAFLRSQAEAPIAAVLAKGDYPAGRSVLHHEFCTVREGELSLSELWFDSWIMEAEKREGRQLTDAEKGAIREKNPPPLAIDFRMK